MKRNMKNAMLFGVCAGIADELKVDPTIIRIIFVAATLAGFGLPVLIYLILALLMQKSEVE